MFRGRLSWRKLSVLIDGLPDDSRLVTAQIDAARDLKDRPKSEGPDPTPRWSQTNWQIHALREEVRHLQYTVVAVASSLAGSKKGSNPPKPLPTPADPRRRTVASADKAALWRHLSSQLRFEGQSDAPTG